MAPKNIRLDLAIGTPFDPVKTYGVLDRATGVARWEAEAIPRCKTTVVNIKTVKHYDVYIGRPGRGALGLFGNPSVVGKTCARCKKIHRFPARTLQCFAEYLVERVQRDQAFSEDVCALRGNVLGCFCAPGPCHGDLIAALIDNDWSDGWSDRWEGAERLWGRLDTRILYETAFGDGSQYHRTPGESHECCAIGCGWIGKPKNSGCRKCGSQDIFPTNDIAWAKW